MLAPLVVLSIGAIFAGYVGVEVFGKGFHGFLEPVFASTFAAASHVAAGGHPGFWANYGLMIVSGVAFSSCPKSQYALKFSG